MAPTRRNNDGLIARVNFPLYTLQMISSRHILVAGGGGSSKTGVANGFEIFELSHNGDTFVAEEIVRHETGPSVVMNCASYNDGKHNYLVAGKENHCQLYYIQTKVIDTSSESNSSSNSASNNANHKNEKNSETRQRRKDSSSENASKSKETTQTASSKNNSHKRISFSIRPSDSIQTDFSAEEPLQKVVRISRTGKIMATGGTDGHLRVWQFPAFRKLHDIKAHTKEIDDIDISPDASSIVTLSKDGLCIVWNTKTGKKISSLSWQYPEGIKYIYKRCRFGVAGSGTKQPASLFTLTNPSGRSGGQKSFLQLWDPHDGTLRRSHGFNESLASLAVRDDGLFVAVGTMFSGSVSVHIAFSLQKVLNVAGAHGMFVTGLEFLPTALDGPAITTPYEAAVISISVDNRVCIHKVPYRHTMPMWLVLILMVLVLCASFTICSYLGV